MHWHLCKDDLNPFKTSKMCHLCFHWRFRQKLVKLWLHFTWFGSHNFAFIKLAAEFIRSTLSFKDNIVFLFDAIFYSKSAQFSIPNTPGIRTPCVITVNIYRSIGISKQSLPTCMHTCRPNWSIIGWSVSVISVQVKLNWLMIMFAKQTNKFFHSDCPLEPGLFEGIY